MKAWPMALAAALAACGAPRSPSSPDAATKADAPSGDAGSDAAAPAFTTLISRSWTMPQGNDDEYLCTRIQIQNDMWVSAFRLIGPPGTHDVVVTFDPNGSGSGDYTPCNSASGTVNGQMIYAAAVGTDDLHFPDGVAIHLAAGQWINLNLHLYKDSGDSLSDTSGVQVETVPQSQVAHEADAMFSGTQTIDVPSDGQPHDQKGGCTAAADWHLVALWPHMHETGMQQSFEVIHTGTGTVDMLLNKEPFSPTLQVNHPVQDTAVAAGDQILTTCTYVVPAATCDNGLNPCTLGTCNINDHRCEVKFGDNALAENCYTAMYKYPAGGSTFGCTQM